MISTVMQAILLDLKDYSDNSRNDLKTIVASLGKRKKMI